MAGAKNRAIFRFEQERIQAMEKGKGEDQRAAWRSGNRGPKCFGRRASSGKSAGGVAPPGRNCVGTNTQRGQDAPIVRAWERV